MDKEIYNFLELRVTQTHWWQPKRDQLSQLVEQFLEINLDWYNKEYWIKGKGNFFHWLPYKWQENLERSKGTTKRINIMASMRKAQRPIVTLPKYRYELSKMSKWQPKLNAKQVSIKKLSVKAIKWEWNKYTSSPRTQKQCFFQLFSIVIYCYSN